MSHDPNMHGKLQDYIDQLMKERRAHGVYEEPASVQNQKLNKKLGLKDQG